MIGIEYQTEFDAEKNDTASDKWLLGFRFVSQCESVSVCVTEKERVALIDIYSISNKL